MWNEREAGEIPRTGQVAAEMRGWTGGGGGDKMRSFVPFGHGLR